MNKSSYKHSSAYFCTRYFICIGNPLKNFEHVFSKKENDPLSQLCEECRGACVEVKLVRRPLQSPSQETHSLDQDRAEEMGEENALGYLIWRGNQ